MKFSIVYPFQRDRGALRRHFPLLGKRKPFSSLIRIYRFLIYGETLYHREISLNCDTRIFAEDFPYEIIICGSAEKKFSSH